MKFRQLVASNRISEISFKFLQNMQDAKSNNLRNVSVTDELQRTTMAPSSTQLDTAHGIDEEEETELHLHLNNFLELSDELDQYIAGGTTDSTNATFIPETYNCQEIRSNGGHKCGFSKLPDFNTITYPSETNFCINDAGFTYDDFTQPTCTARLPPNQQQLMEVIFTHNGQQQQSFGKITGQTDSVSVHKPNGSSKSIVNWAEESKLDNNQQRAFEVITAAFILSYYENAVEVREARSQCKFEMKQLKILLHNDKWESNQLICFLHGPGGSGKSAVIDLVVLYTTSFCKYLWHDFHSNERVIVVTALTGVAATLLQGQTTHAALYLNQKRDITREQIELWSPTKMVIIDEISFASKKDISMINTKLAKLKQQHFLRYGGVNVVFCGDFRQLEPVGANKLPIYAENVPEFKDWINCYIELNGMWRFKHDLRWGKLLQRIRDGKARDKDIKRINKHIKRNSTIPSTIRYASFYNRDRDAINTAIFEERLKACFAQSTSTPGFLIVFSDNLLIQDSSKVYKQFTNPTMFWESFGEDDIKMSRGTGRMDPVLKLYLGCPVMLPTNINVALGQANGTQAIVEQVVLNHGEHTTTTRLSGISVSAVFASQVHSIHLRHSNRQTQPQTFVVHPKKHCFKVQHRKMKATQIPILLNNATTGHKLQGSGVEELFVHNWSYVTNWVYVMLSRVKTMAGLYARNYLNPDLSKYALKPAYVNMVKKLCKKKPETITNDQYTTMLLHTHI